MNINPKSLHSISEQGCPQEGCAQPMGLEELSLHLPEGHWCPELKSEVGHRTCVLEIENELTLRSQNNGLRTVEDGGRKAPFLVLNDKHTERWLSRQEQVLIPQRTRVLFQHHIRWRTTSYNSGLRTLYCVWPPWAPALTCTHPVTGAHIEPSLKTTKF